MSLTKNDLKEQFQKAQEEGCSFVFVAIEAEGVQETICVPKRSFKEKLDFYNKAYTDDLKHVMNNKVHIRGLSRGEPDELNLYG